MASCGSRSCRRWKIASGPQNECRLGHVDLARTPWMSQAERDELHSQRLAWMYAYAWESCSFYRRLWRQHGLGPRSVQGLDDLGALPITDRALLVAHHDEVLVPGEVLYDATTGGTTGHRLRWAYSSTWV